MPKYLNTTGNASLAIAICARCSFKFPIDALSPDRNAPGLRVCARCNDEKDPYRLPPRKPDNIVLKYPRPDEPLTD